MIAAAALTTRTDTSEGGARLSGTAGARRTRRGIMANPVQLAMPLEITDAGASPSARIGRMERELLAALDGAGAYIVSADQCHFCGAIGTLDGVELDVADDTCVDVSACLARYQADDGTSATPQEMRARREARRRDGIDCGAHNEALDCCDAAANIVQKRWNAEGN